MMAHRLGTTLTFVYVIFACSIVFGSIVLLMESRGHITEGTSNLAIARPLSEILDAPVSAHFRRNTKWDLIRYERNHRRPLPVPIRDGHQLIPVPANSKSSLPSSPIRFPSVERTVLFVINDGGFSNVMMGLITSYVVAAFTDSTLLYPRYNFDSLFTVLDMKGNGVRKASMLLLLLLIIAMDEARQGHRYAFANSCFSKKSRLAKTLRVRSVQSFFNTTKSRVSTNCPLFSWMMANEENYRQAVKLGFIDDGPFHSDNASAVGFQLMSTIVRQKLSIKRDIEIAVDKRFEVIGKGPVVGFHIRKGDRHSDFKETRNFLYGGDVKSFMTCSVFHRVPQASIFIASDSTQAKYSLVREFPNRRIIVFNVTAEHTYSAVRNEWGRKRVQTVFVDMMTLARCDYIVGTYKSSFSTLAAAFQGHIPYYVKQRSQCFLPRSIVY